MADMTGRNTKEQQSQRAQARWSVLRGAMLQGRFKERKPEAKEEKRQSNRAIFYGFIQYGIEKGWFKTRSEDGTPLKPIAFEVEPPSKSFMGYAQEAMLGGRVTRDGRVVKNLTPEEREECRVVVQEGEGGNVLVWATSGKLVDTSGTYSKEEPDSLAFVMSKEHELYLFRHADDYDDGTYHGEVLSSQPLVAAGTIKILGGKVSGATDLSGHIRPTERNFRIMQDILNKQGVLDNSYRDNPSKFLLDGDFVLPDYPDSDEEELEEETSYSPGPEISDATSEVSDQRNKKKGKGKGCLPSCSIM